MRDTLRCLISCILPCGALDVVRVVHTNGHVQHIPDQVLASDIMRANPNHVLLEPPITVVVSPTTKLKKGKFYFLVPVVSEKITSTSRHKKLVVRKSDEKLEETRRRRTRGRVGVWRPHLESISEVEI